MSLQLFVSQFSGMSSFRFAPLMLLLWLTLGLCSSCALGLVVSAGQMTSASGGTPAETVAANVAIILDLAAQAHSTGAEFLAVPEFALMGGFDFSSCTAPSSVAEYSEPLPDTLGSLINCSAGTALASIGCSLAATRMHISYNTVEAASGGLFYNTQVVVFNGTFVTRYRKFNVFYKTCFDSPALELITFTIQNYTFGIFTCYDILFDHPKMDLVHEGVKYFSYSSAIPVVGSDAVVLFSLLNAVDVVSANADLGQSSVVAKGTSLAVAPKVGNVVVTATLP